MRVSGISVICLSALCVVGSFSAERGFILTAPKNLDAGSTEYLTFTAINVPTGGSVTIKLLHWDKDEVLAESKVVAINNMNMWVEMTVPPSPLDVKAKLRVKGTFSGGYKIEAEKEVFIRRTSVVTFIQTDKPVYKPGQTVRFRVLPLDSRLKPLESNTKGDVWIQDPTDVRVAQWKQVKLDEGIVQMELPLSNEPSLGTWKIGAVINQVNSYQTFEVEKYVLPKFEVKVKPPPFVMADADIIPVEVCAWYTYGKKVDGTFKVKVTYKQYPWEKKNHAIPSIKYSGLISGCEIINIHTLDILMQTLNFGYRTLLFSAKITENGTGTEGNASASLGITHSPLELTFLGSKSGMDYFKPGLPYFGQLLVTRPDGIPVANEKIEICAHYFDQVGSDYVSSQPKERRCQLFTSSKEGLIHFSIAPMPSDILRISLEAEAVNYEAIKYPDNWWRYKVVRPSVILSLHPWYSPSGNYLQIQPHSGEMECDSRQALIIRYTAEKGVSVKFYHQVLSRGRIVQQGSHQRFYYETDQKKEKYDLPAPNTPQFRPYFSSPVNSTDQPEIGEFLLSFDPRASMSPIARLLVFYVRDNGEIVADSRMIKIAQCFQNKVNMHFRHEQQYPSTEASMLLSASPSSLCGIGLIDKSVRLLKQDEQFSKKNIFNVMERYDVGKDDQPRQVTENYCNLGDTVLRSARTDGDFFMPFSRSLSHHVDTAMAFEEAGMVVISSFQLENRPCVATEPVAFIDDLIDDRRFRIGRKSLFSGENNLGRPALPLPQMIFTKMEDRSPEAEVPQKPSETEEIRNYFPETWLWEMHSVGPSGQTVVKRHLPHTITQWVGGAVCVSPKTGLGLWEESSITAFQPFFVSFTLPYSVVRGEVLPLVVSVFNYLSECLPIKLSLEPSEEYRILSESRSHRLCVCGGESKSHRFSLEPTTLGKINVTMYGFSLEDDDEAVCGNEVTARLSARDAVSKQLLVEAEGFQKEEVFNYFVCPENTNGTYATEIDLLLPEDVIEGSGRAYVSVTGDLMGPALNGLSNLVNLPVGCGEQNMVLFTPNIVVMDYLTSTGRMTEQMRTECLNNMKIGYQREMRYRHKDGSYSAFGSGDKEGSLWLTAFVVRSFGQAMRFIDIDFHDLAYSTAWVLGRQFENGCFEPSGRVHNKAMKGGLTDGEHSLAPLTAYVLISLLESGTQGPDQLSIRNGLMCLETEQNPNNYTLALFAYATTLAQEKRAAYHYLSKLEERATIKGSHMYWESPSEENGSKSVNVEIAGYYILSRMRLDGKESVSTVLPVVRWIAQQRNAQGGFVSTQDTVIALQALAQYSALQSTSPVDIGLVVESDELVKGFKVDEDNKLLTQRIQIPLLPAVVDLQAVGDGCALVQFSLKYNVEKVSGSEALDLSVTVVRLGSSICNLPRLDICMRYKNPDQSTNMAVVSVKMPSGFAPDEWSLYELQSSPEVQLKRHELEGNQVNLYFNELTNDRKCFMFFIKSEIEIEEIKPSSVKLYDYYQPELEITKEFTLPSTCSVPSLPGIAFNLSEMLPTPPPTFPIDVDNEEEMFSILPVPAAEHTFTTKHALGYGDLDSVAESLTTIHPTESVATGPYLPVDEISATMDKTVETPSKGMTTEGLSSETTLLPIESEQADDASPHWPENNVSHLANFLNIDQDLDFPDGIEGNLPVSVLSTVSPPVFSLDEISNCPICITQFPEDFNDIYCNSAFALRVIVRDGKMGTVKILQDISYFLLQPKAMKKFAKLEYDHKCDCAQLREKNSVHFIMGTPTDLWSSEREKHRIRLTNQVHVISIPVKTLQSELLKTARKMCSNDP
ncbi:pregnancy zone protein-like isoform X2 [Argiope bruennichi]|uniref:pregnancy zone protein-like isoform X2 n=1 Tax=Argiope bruennichi TaxID=94029 RepID=UPI002494144D|nr:pregnancy zone protein-like isoform X2 [Argiope bruennichi]